MCSLGARPADVIAGIGPSVAAGSYQVGEEVAAAARDAFGRPQRRTRRALPAADGGPGQWLFDLPAANRHILRAAGVPDGQIHPATPTGPGPGLFFSHRAERPCGRFALAATARAAGRRR